MNENLIDMINVVYNQRELFMKQMQLLFNDAPENEKMALFTEVFKLQDEERNKIKHLKEINTDTKSVLEELHIMSSYNDKLNTLLQEKISLYRRENIEDSENALPSNVIK